MLCPFCEHNGTEVTDSRQINDGKIIKRRRRCSSCKKRFSTHESYYGIDDFGSNPNKSNKKDIYKELKHIHEGDYQIDNPEE